MGGSKIRIVALVVLIVTLVGLAHVIEVNARPDTGRQGRKVEAGHDH